MLRADHVAAAHGVQHGVGEFRRGVGVEQQPHMRAAADARHGELQEIFVILGVVLDGERHEVALRLGMVDRHGDERQDVAAPSALAQDGEVVDLHPVHPRALRREPALRLQIGGRDGVLEGGDFAIAQQPFETARGDEREQFRQVRRRVPRVLSDLLHLEPEEAVGRQGQQIRQLADTRELRAGREFGEAIAVEIVHLQFDRLRSVRHVDDAQDRFVVQLAEIGEDLAVARIEEAERAAAQRLLRSAHHQHAAQPVQERRLARELRF